MEDRAADKDKIELRDIGFEFNLNGGPVQHSWDAQERSQDQLSDIKAPAITPVRTQTNDVTPSLDTYIERLHLYNSPTTPPRAAKATRPKPSLTCPAKFDTTVGLVDGVGPVLELTADEEKFRGAFVLLCPGAEVEKLLGGVYVDVVVEVVLAQPETKATGARARNASTFMSLNSECLKMI